MKRSLSTAFLVTQVVLGAANAWGASAPSRAQSSTVGIPSQISLSEHPSVSESQGCRAGDPDQLCLGIKAVVYQEEKGQEERGEAAIGREEIERSLSAVNQVWRQCRIGFELDEFIVVPPSRMGLAYSTSQYSELTEIRKALETDRSLLVVVTGPWNRKGSLGSSTANAWTSMPGSAPYGAILERPVGTNSNLLAHELGHYLNLQHAKNVSELMNPIIYGHSIHISAQDCETARGTARRFWSRMMRG